MGQPERPVSVPSAWAVKPSARRTCSGRWIQRGVTGCERGCRFKKARQGLRRDAKTANPVFTRIGCGAPFSTGSGAVQSRPGSLHRQSISHPTSFDPRGFRALRDVIRYCAPRTRPVGPGRAGGQPQGPLQGCARSRRRPSARNRLSPSDQGGCVAVYEVLAGGKPRALKVVTKEDQSAKAFAAQAHGYSIVKGGPAHPALLDVPEVFADAAKLYVVMPKCDRRAFVPVHPPHRSALPGWSSRCGTLWS